MRASFIAHNLNEFRLRILTATGSGRGTAIITVVPWDQARVVGRGTLSATGRTPSIQPRAGVKRIHGRRSNPLPRRAKGPAGWLKFKGDSGWARPRPI